MINVGIVGCGNISAIYLKNLTTVFSASVQVVACADLDVGKAKAAAESYGIARILTFEEMLDTPDIDLIVNLTPPAGHYPLSKRALEAGKHVYTEKPLALCFGEGVELLRIAKEKHLYLGCAPDTFLGAGIQTCLAKIEAGEIGTPVGATAFMMCHGHESWHPSPEFYYDFGGGPLFDMGPYYITALVKLLGRAESVFAYASRPQNERLITSKPKFGQKIPVKVDTHTAGLIRFESGAIATLIMSFDVWKHNMPKIEIYGTEGSLSVPDPNRFGGPVLLATATELQFNECEILSPYVENSRGIGVAETELAIKEGRINSASGELGLHVLEIMEALTISAKEGRQIFLESTPSPNVHLDWNVGFGEIKTK